MISAIEEGLALAYLRLYGRKPMEAPLIQREKILAMSTEWH